MCRVDDADVRYTVLSETQPRALKPHRCGECGRTIQPGERYERVDAIGDRKEGLCTEKTCAHCLVARGWLEAECRGWIFQMVYEDLEEHFRDGEGPQLYWLGRVVVGMKRRWQGKRGLMPVPTNEKVPTYAAP